LVTPQQTAVIEYPEAENRVLRERLGTHRVILADAERRNLAEKAKAAGRKRLREVGAIVTPETLLHSHRELVARRWTLVERRRGALPERRNRRSAIGRRARLGGILDYCARFVT
jgi:hypothetical protein